MCLLKSNPPFLIFFNFPLVYHIRKKGGNFIFQFFLFIYSRRIWANYNRIFKFY